MHTSFQPKRNFWINHGAQRRLNRVEEEQAFYDFYGRGGSRITYLAWDYVATLFVSLGSSLAAFRSTLRGREVVQ